MDEKKRRKFRLYQGSTLLATGVAYAEFNIQVLWRHDIGWTAQQCSMLQVLFELFPEANRLDLEQAE